MGRFEKYVFSNGAWSELAEGSPWLGISIHDSDFATVGFQLSPDRTGLFYLGYQPRDYFDNADESADVDPIAEATTLAQWANEVLSVTVDPAQIVPLMAEDQVEEPIDDFVEETVIRLLRLLQLPLPEDLVGLP